jgi:hypothetical protein
VGSRAGRATRGDYFEIGLRQAQRRRRGVPINTEVRNVDE